MYCIVYCTTPSDLQRRLGAPSKTTTSRMTAMTQQWMRTAAIITIRSGRRSRSQYYGYDGGCSTSTPRRRNALSATTSGAAVVWPRMRRTREPSSSSSSSLSSPPVMRSTSTGAGGSSCHHPASRRRLQLLLLSKTTCCSGTSATAAHLSSNHHRRTDIQLLPRQQSTTRSLCDRSSNSKKSGTSNSGAAKTRQQPHQVWTGGSAITTVIQYPVGSAAPLIRRHDNPPPPPHDNSNNNKNKTTTTTRSSMMSAESSDSCNGEDITNDGHDDDSRRPRCYYGKGAVAFALRPTTCTTTPTMIGSTTVASSSTNQIQQQTRMELVEQQQQQKQQKSSCHWGSDDGADNKSDDAPAFPSLFSLQQQTRQWFHRALLRPVLPAQHPESVAAGYDRFAVASFVAAVAGSAGMVLSTQTLLLAVMASSSSSSSQSSSGSDDSDDSGDSGGIMDAAIGNGEAPAAAALLAGAWNWVVKDGLGQLGGVLVASRLSHLSSHTLDADPKRWRLVAALALDGAAALEIAAPLLLVVDGGGAAAPAVLPLAVLATLLKNVGFLLASASRAALHQSLAVTGNLADVTAKAGSQGLAAGTLGTALGVALSTVLASSSGHAATLFHYSYGAAFAGLALVHQCGHYVSLRAVALRHLNRQRLDLVLQHYVNSNNHSHQHQHDDEDTLAAAVLTPRAVAEREYFLPFGSSIAVTRDESRSTQHWLRIGSDVHTMLHGRPRDDVERMLDEASRNGYLIRVGDGGDEDDDGNGDDDGNTMSTAAADRRRRHLPNTNIHLTFLHHATGPDLVRGVLHCAMLRKELCDAAAAGEKTTSTSTSTTLRRRDNNAVAAVQVQAAVQHRVERQFPPFLRRLHAAGWTTDSSTTHIEPSGAVRLAIENMNAPTPTHKKAVRRQ